MTTTANDQLEGLGTYKFGWADTDVAGASARRGLSEEVVRDISARKNEPEWMLDLRLKGLKFFGRKPMPTWGADLSGIDFDNIKYFVRSTEKQAASWDDLPEDIKNTYDRLGIPEAEKQRLVAGVAAQYESEVVYHKIREDLEEKGVIFLDTDTALQGAPGAVPGVLRHRDPGRRQQVRRAQHRGVVRRLVHLRAQGRARRDPAAGLLPDQHREHGPVRADPDHRRRGRLRALRRGLHRADLQATRCTRAVVEIIVKKGARCRYTTIQNWSNNVYNLVTKRAVAQQGATMEWVDGNIGSKVTMKYPAVYLMGEHAKGETLSVAFAGEGQHQDAGAKMVHGAPNTSLDDHLQVGRPRRAAGPPTAA